MELCEDGCCQECERARRRWSNQAKAKTSNPTRALAIVGVVMSGTEIASGHREKRKNCPNSVGELLLECEGNRLVMGVDVAPSSFKRELVRASTARKFAISSRS